MDRTIWACFQHTDGNLDRNTSKQGFGLWAPQKGQDNITLHPEPVYELYRARICCMHNISLLVLYARLPISPYLEPASRTAKDAAIEEPARQRLARQQRQKLQNQIQALRMYLSSRPLLRLLCLPRQKGTSPMHLSNGPYSVVSTPCAYITVTLAASANMHT